MPTFEYRGRNLDGKLINGKRLAQSSDSLSAQLFKEGITPFHIALESQGTWQSIKNWMQGGRISVDELGMFARQMHTLCKTGVPITAAIKQLAETARTIKMTHVLQDIIESLESGQDLASAMQRYSTVFSP